MECVFGRKYIYKPRAVLSYLQVPASRNAPMDFRTFPWETRTNIISLTYPENIRAFVFLHWAVMPQRQILSEAAVKDPFTTFISLHTVLQALWHFHSENKF